MEEVEGEEGEEEDFSSLSTSLATSWVEIKKHVEEKENLIPGKSKQSNFSL